MAMAASRATERYMNGSRRAFHSRAWGSQVKATITPTHARARTMPTE